MSREPAFFSAESFDFLEDLAKNNTKDWFADNKATYESVLKKPSAALREDLEQHFTGLTGQKFSSKLFRINRDLRFSKDKTPYNTHVRIAFWPKDGAFEGKQAQPPSFFLSIETNEIRLGAGSMQFAKPVLERYLTELETGLGKDLNGILTALSSDGFEVSGPDLVKPPRGFPKDSDYADLSRHKGLTAWTTISETEVVIGTSAAGRLIDRIRPALPLWRRLSEIHGIP
ncbi:TIGR02453 family protein [Labrenzia sp. PHM005]|uniref:TIGR02453 family protein n=1 Tax=Labrenzia sp. PHM005 TaxID=2590016 RepID=UPI00114071B6|nr:TIGR02453 family protein [Labrenzia sp. PHM005]QDG76873.1 TIGR02453 family protein [Labrenzia sp. PHM005]